MMVKACQQCHKVIYKDCVACPDCGGSVTTDTQLINWWNEECEKEKKAFKISTLIGMGISLLFSGGAFFAGASESIFWALILSIVMFVVIATPTAFCMFGVYKAWNKFKYVLLEPLRYLSIVGIIIYAQVVLFIGMVAGELWYGPIAAYRYLTKKPMVSSKEFDKIWQTDVEE